MSDLHVDFVDSASALAGNTHSHGRNILSFQQDPQDASLALRFAGVRFVALAFTNTITNTNTEIAIIIS
jgi:hypothetical protein